MAAFAIAGALNWIAHWFRANRGMSADEVAEAFVDVFNRGLLPRPGGRAARAGDPAARSGARRRRAVE